MRTRVVLLDEGPPVLVGERIAQRTVSVRLEAWLVTADGQTRWRSRFIEAEEAVVLAKETLGSEQQRKMALERLARRVAAEIAARLELAANARSRR